MKKRIVSLSLASTLLLGTVAFANNDKALISKVPEKEVTNVEDIVVTKEESNYISHKGKITEVNNVNGLVSILVDQRGVVSDVDETSSMAAIKFNLDEDAVVLSAETQELIKADKLVKDLVVEVSYKKDSAMTKSLPPMTNADAVVVRDEKEEEEGKQLGVKVDRFKNQTSVDNFLKYNLTDDTVIVDAKGEKLTEKDLEDKDLVVFYGPIMTMSIPAQSNAVKIIVLDEEKEVETPEEPNKPETNTEIKVLDKVNIYEGEKLSAELTLKNKIYKSGDTFMLPIRDISEALGYKVSWQSVARQVELTKGNQYLTATANQDMYSSAKMIVKLGKASKVENGVAYVPLNFIKEVMQLDMEVTKEGTISIK